MPKATRKTTTKTTLPVKPNDYGAMVDHLEGHIGVMKHMARYLLCDLEHYFNDSRGEVDEHGNITLNFRVENIDATVWMISELWTRIANLDEMLLDFNKSSAEQDEMAA